MIHLILGTLALAITLALIDTFLPRWLAWALAIGLSYGLIFWT